MDPLVPTTMFPSPPSVKARARETPPLVVTSGSLRSVMWTSPACNRSSLAPALRVFTTSEMITPRHLVTPACWHWEASDASSTTNKRVVLGAVFNPPTLESSLCSQVLRLAGNGSCCNHPGSKSPPPALKLHLGSPRTLLLILRTGVLL